jgi:hypothetical protein
MYDKWCLPVTRKAVIETQYKIKAKCLHISSWVGLFIGSTANWWVKDIKYRYCYRITNLNWLCCNGTCMLECNGWHCLWWLYGTWPHAHHRYVFD